MKEQNEAKVLQFPQSRIVREVPLPAIEAALAKGQQNQIDEMVGNITTVLYGEFLELGLDDEKETFTKDFSFLVDIVRATIYRNFKLKHPMHEFIDKNVSLITSEEIEKIKADIQESRDLEEEE